MIPAFVLLPRKVDPPFGAQATGRLDGVYGLRTHAVIPHGRGGMDQEVLEPSPSDLQSAALPSTLLIRKSGR